MLHHGGKSSSYTFLLTIWLKFSIKFRCWAQFDYQSVFFFDICRICSYICFGQRLGRLICIDFLCIFCGLIRPSPVQAWEIWGSGSGAPTKSGLREFESETVRDLLQVFHFQCGHHSFETSMKPLQHGNSKKLGYRPKRFAVKHMLKKATEAWEGKEIVCCQTDRDADR